MLDYVCMGFRQCSGWKRRRDCGRNALGGNRWKMQNTLNDLTGQDASTTIGPCHKWFLLRQEKEHFRRGELNRWVAYSLFFPHPLLFSQQWQCACVSVLFVVESKFLENSITYFQNEGNKNTRQPHALPGPTIVTERQHADEF